MRTPSTYVAVPSTSASPEKSKLPSDAGATPAIVTVVAVAALAVMLVAHTSPINNERASTSVKSLCFILFSPS